MAQHADDADEIHVLVLFGDGSGRDTARRKNAAMAAKILGASAPRFAGFPENRSDTLPLLDVVAAIESCVAELKTDIVYVSHGGNQNTDHPTHFLAPATPPRPPPAAGLRATSPHEVPSST